MEASVAKYGVLGAPKVLYVVPVGGNPTGALSHQDLSAWALRDDHTGCTWRYWSCQMQPQ